MIEEYPEEQRITCIEEAHRTGQISENEKAIRHLTAVNVALSEEIDRLRKHNPAGLSRLTYNIELRDMFAIHLSPIFFRSVGYRNLHGW